MKRFRQQIERDPVYIKQEERTPMQTNANLAVHETLQRVHAKMRRWGITLTFLASQLDVSRQYVWQAVGCRIPVSQERAASLEQTVDTIIAQQKHMRSFGERLRAARIASGLTLKEVAEMIGYSWVERWEKDLCRPKPGVLWHLFSLYGMTTTPSAHSIRQGMPLPSADAE
jgi:DNA-binding XRE family transcriptional regulator